jgi:hypothetical protein
MKPFNFNKYASSILLICDKCGYSFDFNHKKASCPSCSGVLFKVADRSGTPRIWDRDDFVDPYLRQKQKAKEPGSGHSDKMVSPGDEEGMGGSGLGTRWRGKLSPHDISASDPGEYEQQRKNDIPTSHDDFISNPPRKTELGGWFADPSDPLSTATNINNALDGRVRLDNGSLDQQLGPSRQNKTLRPRSDDSIFSTVSRQQKGNKRWLS